MRNSDPVINPIAAPVLAWFGGGGRRGPSKSEKQAAQQQQQQMQQAAQRQQQMMAQQMAAQREAMEQQRLQQERMMAEMEANKPAPSAQVVERDTDSDMRRQAARRRGLRRSILAGESNQSSVVTGESTLG